MEMHTAAPWDALERDKYVFFPYSIQVRSPSLVKNVMPSFPPNLTVNAISYANTELPPPAWEEMGLSPSLNTVMLEFMIAQVALLGCSRI